MDARNAASERQFKGIIDVYVKTIKADGIRGLYRGFVVSCTCIFIYRGLYFGLYDTLRPVLLSDNPVWLHTFLLGWAVTITSGLTAYPIDTLRRRMMMTSGEKVKYSGSWDCFRQIIRTEGAGALYRGCGVNVVRGVAGAGVLSGFERLKKSMWAGGSISDLVKKRLALNKTGVFSLWGKQRTRVSRNTNYQHCNNHEPVEGSK